jgi:Fe-Mn family superoxide dismutase
LKKLLVLSLVCVSLFSDTYKAKNYFHLLKPGMSGFTESMLVMHFKLYEGYVAQTNKLIEELAALETSGKTGSLEYQGLKRMFGFEYDGMRLHEAYFENLGGKLPLNTLSSLYKQIVADFGSYEIWQADFIATGMLRGSGWVALYFDLMANKLLNVWIGDHQVNHLVGDSLILVMDVWEHAYITEYGLARKDYIDAFLKNVNWNIASNRFEFAKK